MNQMATEERRFERAPGPRTILPSTNTPNVPPAPNLSPDLAVVKQAMELVQQHARRRDACGIDAASP
jgi:hypothetical protein